MTKEELTAVLANYPSNAEVLVSIGAEDLPIIKIETDVVEVSGTVVKVAL